MQHSDSDEKSCANVDPEMHKLTTKQSNLLQIAELLQRKTTTKWYEINN